MVRIGDSDHAVDFTIVAQPTTQARDVGRMKKEDAERHTRRREFWTQLLALAKECGFSLHSTISPSREYWLGVHRDKVNYLYLIQKDRAELELYIDIGSAEENKALFDFLFARRAEIEARYRGTLEWKRLDVARASTIRAHVADSGLQDADEWAEIQPKLIDAMRRFSTVFLPLVKEGQQR